MFTVPNLFGAWQRALCCEWNTSTGTTRVHLNGGCQQRTQGAWALCSHNMPCEYPDTSRAEWVGRCTCAVLATGEQVYSKLYVCRDGDVSTLLIAAHCPAILVGISEPPWVTSPFKVVLTLVYYHLFHRCYSYSFQCTDQKSQLAVSVSQQPDPSMAMSSYHAYVPNSSLTYLPAQSCNQPLLARWWSCPILLCMPSIIQSYTHWSCLQPLSSFKAWRCDFPLHRDHWDCLLISTFMLASKVIHDDAYSNKLWLIVTQGMFQLREITQMEKEMC